jgi:hypothetical protein
VAWPIVSRSSSPSSSVRCSWRARSPFKKDGSLHAWRHRPVDPEPTWSACAHEVLATTRLTPPPNVPLVTRYHFAL